MLKKLYNALSHLRTIGSYFSMNIKTIIFLEIVNKYHNTSVFLWKVNFEYKRWIIFIHMEYMKMLMNDADFFLIEKKVIYLLVVPQLYQTVDVGYFLFAFHDIKIRPLLNCAVVSLRALVGSIKLSALDFIIFTKRSNSWKYKPQFLSKEGLVTLTRKFHAIKKENIIDLKKPSMLYETAKMISFEWHLFVQEPTHTFCNRC